MNLQAGQNIGLTQLSLTAILAIKPGTTPLVLDPSAFLLTASGRVENDDGMVFYGQPSVENGAVRVDSNSKIFSLDLQKIPAKIERIALAITIENATQRGQNFGQLQEVSLTLSSQSEALSFTLPCTGMKEAALIIGEFYIRNGAWKFRAVGQGFNGGLGPLAKHFGVDISDDPESTPPLPTPIPAPAPASVNLTKITLEKHTPISLEKPQQGFGEILVNLNWKRLQEKPSSWNPLKAKNSGIDLDLGGMYELMDGRKGVVQALGNTFGQLNQAPYMQLMGDDRTGAASDGENLRINGNQWAQIRRIVIFAFIYEGTPNWAAASAVISVKAPGQSELIIQLDNHSSSHGMCAVALLTNDNGRIKLQKLVDYYSGHKQLDEAHGFGFQWKAGHK